MGRSASLRRPTTQTLANNNMTDEEFENYLAMAVEELEEKQDQLEKVHNIGHHEHFVVEYDKGILTFFEHEKPIIEAKIIPLATHVAEKDSLKWFWANEDLPENIINEAILVKGLYDITDYEMFRNETLECDEEMAWEICALACKYLEKLGVYKIPHGNINGYVLLKEIKKYG